MSIKGLSLTICDKNGELEGNSLVTNTEDVGDSLISIVIDG